MIYTGTNNLMAAGFERMDPCLPPSTTFLHLVGAFSASLLFLSFYPPFALYLLLFHPVPTFLVAFLTLIPSICGICPHFFPVSLLISVLLH